MKGNFLNHRLWTRLQTRSFEECKFQQCIHYTVWCMGTEIVFKPIPIFLFSREIKEGEIEKRRMVERWRYRGRERKAKSRGSQHPARDRSSPARGIL